MRQAKTHADLNEYIDAISEYTQAISLDSNNADAWFGRGLVYGAIKDHTSAISDFSKAINLKPKDAKAYYYRGAEYALSGENEKAVADMRTVLDLSDDPELRRLATYFVQTLK